MAAQINADADDVVVVAVAVDDDAADTGNAIVVEAKKLLKVELMVSATLYSLWIF